ncbi:hypothetical protein FRC17_004715 [Serendipita sp. 399]|nr:hypothetical protein FRC17_004715 [Serendipita sp. 399]
MLANGHEEPREPLAFKTLIHPTSSTALPLRQDGTVFVRLGRKLSTMLPGHAKADEEQTRRPSLKIGMQTEIQVLTEDTSDSLMENVRDGSLKGSANPVLPFPQFPSMRSFEGSHSVTPTESPTMPRGYHYTRKQKSQTRAAAATLLQDHIGSSPTLLPVQYHPVHDRVDSLVDLSGYSLRPNEMTNKPQPLSLSPLDTDMKDPQDSEPLGHRSLSHDTGNNRVRAINPSASLRDILRSVFGLPIGSKHGKGRVRVAKSAFTVARKSSLKKRKPKRPSFTELYGQGTQRSPITHPVTTPNRFNVRLPSTPALLPSPVATRLDGTTTPKSQRRKTSLPSFLTLL